MRRHLFTSPLLLTLASTLHAQAPLYDLGGLNGDTLGTAIAPIADLDGDGVDDLILGGAYGDGLQPDAGRVVVVSGKTGATLLLLQGANSGDRFGYSVASRPDVNNDGKEEILVGIPGHDGPGGSNTGRVETYLSNGGGMVAFLQGSTPGDQFGWCVRRLGDCNHDGIDDFAVGAPYFDFVTVDRGRVSVHSGAGFSMLDDNYGTQAGELFGYSLDFIEDVNADGWADLIVGAPGYDTLGNNNAGAVRLVSTFSFVGAIWSLTGGSGMEFGFSVAGLEDVDGDGLRDFAAAEPGWAGNGANAGRVRVYSGDSQTWLRDFEGVAGERLGFTLASAGDFDGDGRGDMIAGAPGYDLPGVFDAGRALVFSASSGALLTGFPGNEALGQMGLAVASLGDLNGDGADEAAAGAPFEDWGHVDAGHVRVHLGDSLAPQAYCTAKVNSAGCTPFISYAGAASWTLGAGLTVVGANVLPSLPGLMIWSKNPNSAPFFGGTLCVGTPLFRTSGQVAGNNPLYPCTGQYAFQVDVAFLSTNGLLPGMDVYAQIWSRDLGFAAPNNVGLTNGLRFQVLN